MCGRSMCTLCNVFMFNKMLREQSQTSFHGGVLCSLSTRALAVSKKFLLSNMTPLLVPGQC